MTLKEEFEILRGEPIQVCTGDPCDIPCIETSDPERLCQHPVVSVHMITYNHEPYIREAIEGVMMQKTDFEFELVIGEDCSTDKTREICFEYQKRYPDKIRVLWCDHNLYRNPHPAGGNGARNMAHCRGEFIAFCEGDDYWIEPQKLQKQVDVMRKYPNVGLCFTGAEIHYQKTGFVHRWKGEETYEKGLIEGREFHRLYINWKDGHGSKDEDGSIIMTNSMMLRTSVVSTMVRTEEIFRWKLRLSDCTFWLGATSISDAYYIPDVMAVYRLHSGGISHTCTEADAKMYVDGRIVRLYWTRKTQFGTDQLHTLQVLFGSFLQRLPWKNRNEILTEIKRLSSIREFAPFLNSSKVRFTFSVLRCKLIPLAFFRAAILLRRRAMKGLR